MEVQRGLFPEDSVGWLVETNECKVFRKATVQTKTDVKGQAINFFLYLKRKMYRNSLQHRCELATNHSLYVQNPKMP